MYKKSFPFAAIFLSVFFAACQSSSTSVNSDAQNPANQTTDNRSQTAANANQTSGAEMNHTEMNHGEMNHSAMKSAPDAGFQSFDLQFLDTMSAHHQGAVDMAKMAQTKAASNELKTFAAAIIADQQREIGQMKSWREQWFAGKPSAMNMEMRGMNDSMKGMDMTRLGALSGAAFDLEFVKQMIPHHVGAVEMSREALEKAEHAEIKTLSNQIIKAQEAEIKMMNDWTAKWSK